MIPHINFLFYFVVFLLYGCALDVFATQLLIGIARQDGFAYATDYRLFHFQKHRLLHWLLGEETSDFMDTRSLCFPLIEIVTAVFLALCAQRYGFCLKLLECIASATILLIAALIDSKMQIFPVGLTNLLIILGIMSAFANGLLNGGAALVYQLKGGFCGFGIAYLVRTLGTWAFKKEAYGIGDIHMCTGLGLFLGWDLFLVFFFVWPFAGLLIASYNIIKSGPTIIATGPLYLPGFLLCLLYSDEIKVFFLNRLIEKMVTV